LTEVTWSLGRGRDPDAV